MTEDQIIELAIQGHASTRDAIRWALSQLRNRCWTEEHWNEYEESVVAMEREACAKIADEWSVAYPHPSESIAERIRERGEK